MVVVEGIAQRKNMKTLVQKMMGNNVIKVSTWGWDKIVIILAIIFSTSGMIYTLATDTVVAYGDAESHLNIAKRVVSGLTPGFAQLGGVWLPIPHLLMLPFVYFDFLWRTGLAGAFVSGIAYVISGYILFKISYLLTKSNFASLGAFLFFALNPNVLYLQSTPMTEVPFIAFFLLSVFFFLKYLKNNDNYISLALAALFTFLATLTRYDGWALVGMEGLILFLQYAFRKATWKKTEARIFFFGVLAVFGIFIWLAWDGLILHDPFYFTNSSFSAKSQQQGWETNGELPADEHITTAIYYYTMTSVANIGAIASILGVLGLVVLAFDSEDKNRLFYPLLLFTPFIFNVYALWAGQSALYVPSYTPANFFWHLFNARYGTIMVAVVGILIGYLFYRFNLFGKTLIAVLLIVQLFMFYSGKTSVVTYDDAVMGLSTNSKPDSYNWKWVSDNYDGGKVLLDDYLRSISLVKSGIPMQNIIYVGSKPYYQESFKEPELYARWIFIRQGDDVYNNLYTNPKQRAKLTRYFTKVFSTSDLMIYKRNNIVAFK